jgi:hypothetical protein
MAAKYWLKLYHEMLHDYKMFSLSDRLYRRVIECFLMAGEKNEDGILPSIQEMAFTLRTDEDELARELRDIEDTGILTSYDDGWIVTNFSERQAAISDAERVRRWRDRRQKDQYKGDDVTNRNVDIDTESDIDTEIDLDKIASDDLFDACVEIYEGKKGKLVTDGQAFAMMIVNFKANGVTADDYAAAIDAMDADDRYKGSKPTSYERWAIGYAEKRKNPTRINKQTKTNEEILEEMYANGEL